MIKYIKYRDQIQIQIRAFSKSQIQIQIQVRLIQIQICKYKYKYVFDPIPDRYLYKYCELNDLLSDKNSGFKPNDSTVNQLTLITHKLYKALDQKQNARMVFLDLSKAFDKVWHNGLIFKLKRFGITGILLSWFFSYLENRIQRVVLDGKASQWERLHAGVPQGSVLGPLLFFIFINNLVDTLETDPHLFVDDTSLLDIYFDPRLSCLKINRDLRKISDWGKVWKVTFNLSQTNFIVFSHHQSYPEYPNVVFNGVNVVRTIGHVYLGLTITSNLSWRKHIFTVINKASRAIHILNFVKHRLARSSGFSSLYKTTILPILEYCDIIYDNCTVRESAALEQVQRRAALVCTSAYEHTRTDHSWSVYM